MATSLGYIVAFGGGIISFASPCVLPLVPAYLSIITGIDIRDKKRIEDKKDSPTITTKVKTQSKTVESISSTQFQVAKATLYFILGFGTVFVLLGMTATALGRSIFHSHILIGRITGLLVLVMGVFIVIGGLGRFNIFASERRFHPNIARLGRFGPAIAGVAFGFGWTPCIGPILSSILGVAASQKSVTQGAILLVFYSLGLGVPFMITGLAYTRIKTSFDWLKRQSSKLSLISGFALIFFGLLLAMNRFSLVTIALNGFFTKIGLSKLVYLG
ncbi:MULTISPECIES: cytochrome c biogenesis protein CcdA [Acidithrix]|uniref:Cytochrome C biogenesis protein transmembrane region n=1 Tax=Acidithrix ferrooxidans TaxID=1280514 RepID=A0A0D8HF06_9ACTN|nr:MULTISPECIES: cytochrome c biogenesis protein CcdA [Acidithrix]ATZ76168.1 cytochrome c-type biogenesis protein CcdA; thiol-disulfide oxido-reductase [uncultured Acidithrix sp.]KJF16362.1 cytochrome C biogenesis protein transmembrane region [Acidithrix ferrooxidans]